VISVCKTATVSKLDSPLPKYPGPSKLAGANFGSKKRRSWDGQRGAAFDETTMSETKLIWRFSLAALAVWRVAHLLTERGSAVGRVTGMRTQLGDGMAGRLIDCFVCLSLWVSMPLAVWFSDGWVGLLVHWQALSGAASLFQRVSGSPQPMYPIIESFEGDASCFVVRSEAH
jgi:hypothetical protein